MGMPPFRYLSTLHIVPETGHYDVNACSLIVNARIKLVLQGILKIILEGLAHIPSDNVSGFVREELVKLGVFFDVEMMDRSIAGVISGFQGRPIRLHDDAGPHGGNTKKPLSARQKQACLAHGTALLRETIKIFHRHLTGVLSKLHPQTDEVNGILLQSMKHRTPEGESLCVTLNRV